jgi:CRP-like cAMP-binding protein
MFMSKKIQVARRRKHFLSEKTKSLSASALAQKIGYLHITDLPHTAILEDLPTQSFSPHRIIRCKDELLLIKQGLVEIWHTHHDYLVKELGTGVLFGELSMLGQTMLGTKAIVGTAGATVSVMNADIVREWVKANPVTILEKLGHRLAEIEAQHYRSSFQLVDSRVAALLLELVGEGSTVEGLTHGEMAEMIGVYRETVTTVLQAMKVDRLIEIGRKTITILDRRAMQDLSDL